jgi:hypothetical protein
VVLRKSIAILCLLALLLGILKAVNAMLPAGRAGSTVTWQPFVLFLSPAVALTIGAFGAIILPPPTLRRAILVLMLVLLVGSILLPVMAVPSAIASLGFVFLAFVVPKQ